MKGDIYADIIVNIIQTDLDRSFQYRIPEALREEARVGSRVRIPFGSGRRRIEGYILSVSDRPRLEADRIKDILEVIPGQVTAETRMIRLAAWMRETYGSTMIQALKTILPVRETVRDREKKYITLAVQDDEVRRRQEEARLRHYSAKVRLLEELVAKRRIDKSHATGRLKVSEATLKSMQEAGLIRMETEQEVRFPAELAGETEAGGGVSLSEDQADVVRGILAEWEGEDRTVLLQGITGSGKTLVYMELIREVLKKGRSAILLIPEISLSWQTVRRFQRRFGKIVAVLHSRMSEGERSDQYRRAVSGEARIVIGPRSALFVPVEDLGLILIDEEQETSYRSEQTPRYDAREAAAKRAELEGAHLVLGSATPSVDSFFAAEQGRYALFVLSERYGGACLPEVKIVDMREEMKAGGRSVLGSLLREAVGERLDKGEQSILFLNRRGYAGFVSCRSCGEVIKCPHCDVSLTLHGDGRMVCHYCGYEQPSVRLCPTCGSPYIGSFGIGTQKVVEEVRRFFPGARILRMDADTTRRKDDYGRILSSFAEGDADILVGTQMIVKGHDFPNVTLVGALSADLSLFAGDYRAAEKTFQILVQAVGRAGRGEKRGQAVIQTYHPDHYAIEMASRQDYRGFYEEEILSRDMMGYPPCSNLLAIHASCLQEGQLSRAMYYIRKYIERIRRDEKTILIGPAEENISRIQDRYRQALYVKEADLEEMIRIREKVEAYVKINYGFRGVMLQYDLNV